MPAGNRTLPRGQGSRMLTGPITSGHKDDNDFWTDSPYSWRRLLYSVLIGVISNASLWTSVALMPSLQAEFGTTRTEASYPYVAIILGFLMGSPFLGRFSDRHGITRALIIASIVASASYIGGGLTSNFYLFLIMQVLVGIGTSAGHGPLTADLSHWFRKRRGLAVAIVSSGAYLSGIFWSAIISDVLIEHSWRTVHFLIGFASLSIIPLSLLLRRRVTEVMLDYADRRSAERSNQTGLAPNRIKWLLAVAGVSCCVAMATPQVHIVALCLDLGLTVRQGSELISAMLLGGIAARLVSGAIVDRVGPLTILVAGSILQLIALCCYIPLEGFAPLYIVSLIFGLAQGALLPSYPLIVREYLPARSAGAAVSFLSTATQFGMAAGGWLSGWIYDQTGSYFVAFVNGIGWNLLNLLLIGFLALRIYGRRPAPIPIRP